MSEAPSTSTWTARTRFPVRLRVGDVVALLVVLSAITVLQYRITRACQTDLG